MNTVYFIYLEEPGLEKRFSQEYVEYKKHVPKWIPRLRPVAAVIKGSAWLSVMGTTAGLAANAVPKPPGAPISGMDVICRLANEVFMKRSWQRQLKFDPLPALLASGDEALGYFVRRDLLQEDAGPVCSLWQLPQARKILRQQQPDGSWDRPLSQKKHPAISYALIETWKQFRFLVEQYGFTREDPSAVRAAEFLFSCQTEAGDIRGMLANQYANYYTGAIMSLLIRAGYEDDPRIEKGFQWLLSMRQHDMGWSEALITHHFDRETLYRLTSQYAEPVEPDRSRPFSHNSTGMVLRAFAAHGKHRGSEAAKAAARLLKSRFFQPDRYTSYQAASYWLRFQYPFWWNNLVAALDSISLIDPARDKHMEQAFDWLIAHQAEDGLWEISYVTGEEAGIARSREMRRWVSLAICRVLSRVSGEDFGTPNEHPDLGVYDGSRWCGA